MRTTTLGQNIQIPNIAIGCMRLAEKSYNDVDQLIKIALEHKANFFDHADIYGNGRCEELFGDFINNNKYLRDQIFIQTKCGIIPSVMYDLSYQHIIESVNNSLKRLKTDYIDLLALHRPDALLNPKEIAKAFDELKSSGKVLHFGVSNMKPTQIELIKKFSNVPIVSNQVQYSLVHTSLVSQGLETNMNTTGSIDRDNSLLDYCHLNDITVQAWSPLQKPNWQGTFIENSDFSKLNYELWLLTEKYNVSKACIAMAWILQHPQPIQVISGSVNPNRIPDLVKASEIILEKEEWYRLYLAAGNILP